MRTWRIGLLILRNVLVCFMVDLGCLCLLLVLFDVMPQRIPQHRPFGRTSRSVNQAVYNRQRFRLEDISWYRSAPWLRLRQAYLAEHPLCATCKRHGKLEVSTHVHHIRDRKQYPELAFDWDNLEALCCSCHSRLHAREVRR